MSPPEALAERYEALAERLTREDPSILRGTMMGLPCIRREGRFFASLERDTGRLILKLPSERVEELVAAGIGSPFAPNGKVFREWVALEEGSDWDALTGEALAFATDG